MEERNYWLGFSVFPGIGPQKFKLLLQTFGSAKSAWQAPKPRLARLIGEKIAERFDQFRNTFSVGDCAKKLAEKQVNFLIITDKEYPTLLKEIKNPPFMLYVKGNKEDIFCHSGKPKAHPESVRQTQDKSDSGVVASFLPRMTEPIIAVVGTRKITQYGRDVTELLTSQLVSAGFTIVSGLAIGVDAVAHQTTIDQQGKTIAVLGCGVDCCTPRENQYLYDAILGKKNGLAKPDPAPQGCIVSEFPLNQAPTKGSFPSRNRIIAGLSLGVLVTEGAEDSGALITAEYALSFGRRVFAVPGQITSSLSKGPYKLLKKGAKLVTRAEDILHEFKMQNAKGKTTHSTSSGQAAQSSKVKRGDTKEEEKILEILENEPLHFDEIVRTTGMDSAKVGSILSLMEMKGMVREFGGGAFGLS